MLIIVSVGVTQPSSLFLAHAPDQNPHTEFGCPYFDMSLQVATSPCWKMALPDVISAIFVWALGSVPRHDPTVLFFRFFPLDIGLPLGSRRSARKIFPQRSFVWGRISGLQSFVYLQAPILAWPTDCSDLQGSMSLQPPGRIHRAVLAPLPMTSSGITTCPNRTIDTTGLVKVFTFTHLLDRSLVGCS